MMLAPELHVPHVVAAEVPGIDGGMALALQHCGETDCAEVWVQDKDRERMAGVRLDLAGWQALLALVDEMTRRLAPKETHVADH